MTEFKVGDWITMKADCYPLKTGEVYPIEQCGPVIGVSGGLCTCQDKWELEDFKNVKIRVHNEKESRNAQQFLFNKGFRWASGYMTIIEAADMVWLTTNGEHGDMYWSHLIDSPGCADKREIKLPSIIDKSNVGTRYGFPHYDIGADYGTGESKSIIQKPMEEPKMKIEEMNQINLTEAKKQFDEEKKNAEIEFAKSELRKATDRRDELMRQRIQIDEQIAEQAKIILKFIFE